MTELPKETRLYRLNSLFAQKEKLPVYFVARPIIQTELAVYLYGRGTREAQTIFNACCKCGATLSHPGSIILGIGPECLGNWGVRDDMIRDKTQEEIDQIIGKIIKEQKVDCWIPKSVIKEIHETKEEIEIPKDHPMSMPKNTSRKASEVTYQNSKLPAVKIQFPFDRDLLEHVKTLSGRSFHNEGAQKYWTCPRTKESVLALKGWGFMLDEKLEAFLQESKEFEQRITCNVNQVDEIEVPGLKMKLFPFQKKGVAFIEQKMGRGLLGDEMGLGKTCQALAYLQLHLEKRPTLIVVPASLKLNWEREANMWMPDPKIQILSGTKTATPIIGEIIIINYDILPAWVGVLSMIDFKVLILDECHYIKNNKAKRTKAVKMIAKRVRHVIALSGTPIINRPIEIYNAIKLIEPKLFPNLWEYARRYCGARHNGFGWDFNGASHTEELHEKLINTIMLRRKKSEVLTELPPKLRSIVPMEINNRKEYKRAEEDFIEWLSETKGIETAAKAMSIEALAKIEYLKQLSVAGKMEQAIEWIENFIEVDGKLVVFAWHKETINKLMEKFGPIAVKVDGSVSQLDRQKAVDTFQNDERVRLFIGNIKAAGVGITLTAASNVAFLELGWSPGEHDQAEDRIHRIGQEAQSINAYYLLAAQTIEDTIARLIDKKRKILDAVLDGKTTEQESLLAELMKTYRA